MVIRVYQSPTVWKASEQEYFNESAKWKYLLLIM